MLLTSEWNIAADNGMWLTYHTHLEKVLGCQKEIKRKVQAVELKQKYWRF